MNKQDKKEIMNLIKYKKMLGGRRMKLIQGDCLEIMKEIPDKSIDLIVTDPPPMV